MCGISGEVRFDGRQPRADLLSQVGDQMERRGPDSLGQNLWPHVGFSHRRLKIMDLSEHSHQPMVDSHLELAIVFNGAIYNHPELRQELEGKGYHFFSTGDTEVVLKAYHAWGEECLQHFNGMFAFTIYDRNRDELFCARDRLGIKPFYYSKTSKNFCFASSLPALLEFPEVDRSLDPEGLHHYLTFHAVVPPPKTLLKGVQKLPQGHFLRLKRSGEVSIHKYWEPEYGPRDSEQAFGENEWKERLHETMRDSVNRRMVADVPVGVLLSGGLDSSLVVGLLHEAGCKDLKTFSIGFESVGGEKGDEFEYSDCVAEHFKTDHHQLFIPSENVLQSLIECIGAMSEPMVSHDNVAFYLLSKEVKKHVKVVQSGQGADEIFAGYHWYPPLMQPQSSVDDYAQLFFDREHSETQEMVRGLSFEEDYSYNFVKSHFAQPGAESTIDKALRLDSMVMLVDDPVKRVDNMTMAWGLEARVPFLDHEVVELAARIPAQWKVKNHGKYILAQMARDVIPSKVIDRPKGYFPVPAVKYLQGEYLQFVKETLTSPTAKQRGLFDAGYLEKLFSAPEEHLTPLRGSKLWQVAVLELWMQTHKV